jgi:hypothetical protein
MIRIALAIAFVVLVAAPAAHAQGTPCGTMGAWNCAKAAPEDVAPAAKSCLIVKHKGTVGRRLMWTALIGVPIAPGSKYDYVDSIDLPSSKLTYHGDELEKMQQDGIHVVVLNNKFAASDLDEARKSCRESIATK